MFDLHFISTRISPSSLRLCGKEGKLRRKWSEIADRIYKNLNEKNRATSSWKKYPVLSGNMALFCARIANKTPKFRHSSTFPSTTALRTMKLKDSFRRDVAFRFIFLSKCNVTNIHWKRTKEISFFLNINFISDFVKYVRSETLLHKFSQEL